jgi:hypothetical protein
LLHQLVSAIVTWLINLSTEKASLELDKYIADEVSRDYGALSRITPQSSLKGGKV